MNKSIGAVAAGHQATAETAAEILRDGGNAFDAIVAAHMTACVVEPVLASFAGGGFLLAETGSGNQILYDFFVQIPCKIKEKKELNFFPISADFGYALQEFHIGPGSVATPGTVGGLFSIHRDLCSMPFSRLSEQAKKLAKDGVEMNSFQAGAMDIVSPIYWSNDEATEIFKSPNTEKKLIREGEELKQPMLANFIDQLAKEGEQFFYDGVIAEKICMICNENGGHLTREDFKKYCVKKRDPLHLNYRDASLNINPPPSSGGLLIAFALKLMEAVSQDSLAFNSLAYPDLLIYVQDRTNRARIENMIEKKESEEILHGPFLKMYQNQIIQRLKSFNGTTQISVADHEGNIASLTTSNGAGSGVMIPECGVMLNNMLGEEDLNLQGFYQWPEDERISSMMAPVILGLKNGGKVALGSGGSNRIRTAILQVLLNLVDKKMDLNEAIQAPRVHFENDFLNAEKGFSEDALQLLKDKYSKHKIWEKENMFFGGTHAISRNGNQFSGFGDPRRGGVSIVV